MRAAISAVVLSVVLGATSAAACEAGICIERLVPGDGDEVPINARMWVFYDNVNSFPIEAKLYDGNDDEVPTTVQTYQLGPKEVLEQQLLMLTPQQDLEPNAAYELVVMPEEDLCGGANTVAAFTTSGAGDYTNPTFDGIAAIEAVYVEDYSAGSNCTLGPPRQRYAVRGTEAPDAVAYMLYEDGALVGLSPTGLRAEGGGVPRPPNVVTYDVMSDDAEIEPRCFVIHAIDIAGNEEADVDQECMDDPDADPYGNDGEFEDPNNCSCSSAPAAAAPSMLMLLSALVAWRRIR